MAIFDTVWYLNYGNGSSTGYYAVSAWATSTAYAAGQMVRQLAAPSVGNERIFICISAGTSGGSEPGWNLTYGAKTTDNSVTWMEITGRSAVNGDATNTNNWTALKNTAVVLGQLMKNNAGTHYFIVTTAGTTGNGSEPGWNTTTGATTADNTVTWTCIGTVGSFTAWGAPHARMATVAGSGFMAAGNTCYVANNHAETQSSLIAIPVGNSSMASPFTFLCVSNAAAPPTSLAATATVTTTGTSNLQINPFHYTYGVTFSCGTGASATTLFHGINNCFGSYDTCGFVIGSTNSGSTISQNSGNQTASHNEYNNCSFKFGATGQSIRLAWNSVFKGGCIFAATGSIPTTLFLTDGSAAHAGRSVIRDCDLSAITGTLVNVGGGHALDIYIENCKLGAGVAVTTSTSLSMNSANVHLHNSDSSATNYRYAFANYAGTVQQETTIVRSGGASDGATPISWNFTTTANSGFTTPLGNEGIVQWNDATGSSKTATIYLTSNSALNNNDVWMDIEYPSLSGFPQGAGSGSRMAWLGTPAALTSDASSWGGSTSNKYKMSVSFTPQMKGPVKCRIALAKPSTTIYVDPYIYIQ